MLVVLTLLLLGGDPPLQAMSPDERADYVSELAEREPSFAARVGEVARRSLGTPYHDGPLGEGPVGVYDTDPLVDFKRVDCVTYVEQSLALASAPTYGEAMENLLKIRYFGGYPNFENRNHFMISDWIANNPYCVEITGDLDAPTDAVTRTISRKDFFVLVKADGLGEGIPDQDVTLNYVPTSETATAEKALPNASLVVFVGNVDWLFSLHCGLYLRDETGEGKLYHASSKSNKVVAVDLDEYMQSQASRYIGFTAYQITEPQFVGK